MTSDGDIDRPELAADAALVKPRHVGHQRLVRALVGAAREPVDAQPVIFAQLLGQVVVAVDQRRRLEDAVDPRLDLGVDRLRLAAVGMSANAAASRRNFFIVMREV